MNNKNELPQELKEAVENQLNHAETSFSDLMGNNYAMLVPVDENDTDEYAPANEYYKDTDIAKTVSLVFDNLKESLPIAIFDHLQQSSGDAEAVLRVSVAEGYTDFDANEQDLLALQAMKGGFVRVQDAIKAMQTYAMLNRVKGGEEIDTTFNVDWDKVERCLSRVWNRETTAGTGVSYLKSIFCDNSNDWISVEDELPEGSHVDCIIWDEEKGFPLIANYDYMTSFWRDNFKDVYEGNPTHWKPFKLSAPPLPQKPTTK